MLGEGIELLLVLLVEVVLELLKVGDEGLEVLIPLGLEEADFLFALLGD